nr:lysosomal acid phosphatase-like [Halyomorpha halys]
MAPLNTHASTSDVSTIRFISVITRHGSRSPTETYPKDPYPYTNPKFWPDGPGQLTRFGKQQLYATGQTLRMRYNGFLNVNYFPNDNIVRSNRYDRDFMSAACLLAGLYPPAGYQLWNPAILWQPIPIWEELFDVAELAERPGQCPRYAAEQKKAITELNRHSGRYKKLFSYLSKHMGKKITHITSIIDVWDVLQLQMENGYKLPQWTKSVFPEKIARLYAISFNTVVSGTPEMIRLTAGPVMKMVNQQLVKKASGKMKPDRLLFIEAAHDTTLQALLSSLGYEDPFPIETSAFMVFELHESTEGHTVQVLYYNSSAHIIPNVLDPPNCRKPCSLTAFSKFVNSIAPADWEAECNNATSDSDT